MPIFKSLLSAAVGTVLVSGMAQAQVIKFVVENGGSSFSFCGETYVAAQVGFHPATDAGLVLDSDDLLNRIFPAGNRSRVLGFYNGIDPDVVYSSGGEFEPLGTLTTTGDRDYGAFYVLFESGGPLTFHALNNGATASVNGSGNGGNFGEWHDDLESCDNPYFRSSDTKDLPEGFELAQNHPNPFNPSTTIRFALPETDNASLVVYDMAGREVATLLNGMTAAGEHSLAFDASALSSGVYFYRLQAGEVQATRRMLLIK